jgi:hypothetical protein
MAVGAGPILWRWRVERAERQRCIQGATQALRRNRGIIDHFPAWIPTATLTGIFGFGEEPAKLVSNANRRAHMPLLRTALTCAAGGDGASTDCRESLEEYVARMAPLKKVAEMKRSDIPAAPQDLVMGTLSSRIVFIDPMAGLDYLDRKFRLAPEVDSATCVDIGTIMEKTKGND